MNLKPTRAAAAKTSVPFAKATVGELSSASTPPTIALTSYATGTTEPSVGWDANRIVPDGVCRRSVVDALKADAFGVFTMLAIATTMSRWTTVPTFPALSVTLISRRYVESDNAFKPVIATETASENVSEEKVLYVVHVRSGDGVDNPLLVLVSWTSKVANPACKREFTESTSTAVSTNVKSLVEVVAPSANPLLNVTAGATSSIKYAKSIVFTEDSVRFFPVNVSMETALNENMLLP